MTILSRIRSRVGLLVGIIFLALLSFVLTDMFNTQHGIFSSGPGSNDVGEINGHSVSISEFSNRVDAIAKDRQMTEQERSQLQDGVWQELIDKYVFEPQYKALGLKITDDELAEQMYGPHVSPYLNQWFQDRQTGQINPQYAKPDGTLNGAAVAKLVGSFTSEQETEWAQIEGEMRKFLIKEKYNNMLRKGFYVTNAQAKREYADENTKMNYKFIVKKYSDVPDSTVKVTDEEMMSYYNANAYKFKQRDNNRSMEYVAFDILPSADDIAKQREDMKQIAETFKTRKAGAEDSSYVASMNESGQYDKKFLHAGQFPAGTDSAFFKAAPGEVLGPYNNGDNIDIYKVLGHKTSADSAKVRHILIAYKGGERADPSITRTKEQAKAKADSLLRAIKGGKKMEDLVEKFTDDPGSKSGNKGDYGWFSEESGFVQEFKDAGFKNPVGATVVVETAFGYHVIQVLDRTKETMKVEVETIEKKVEPSETTIREIYNKASEFAGKNNTPELFTKACEKDGLNVLKADNVTEGAKYISGIDNPRDIARWMYDEKTEKGSISSPFQSGERYLVCHLTKILEKGTKPFEEVRDICELEARKIKKAQMFTDQLNKVKANSLEQWATNANLTIQPGVNTTFAQPYIAAAGYEGAVIGTLASMKPGQLFSSPIKGSMGVYVVMLESVTQPEPMKDIAAQKTKIMQGLTSRADGSSAEILKDEANIIDNRAKHF